MTVSAHDASGNVFNMNFQLIVKNPADFTNDGRVTLADFAILRKNFGTRGDRSKGDANGDGRIDIADFAILRRLFGT